MKKTLTLVFCASVSLAACSTPAQQETHTTTGATVTTADTTQTHKTPKAVSITKNTEKSQKPTQAVVKKETTHNKKLVLDTKGNIVIQGKKNRTITKDAHKCDYSKKGEVTETVYTVLQAKGPVGLVKISGGICDTDAWGYSFSIIDLSKDDTSSTKLVQVPDTFGGLVTDENISLKGYNLTMSLPKNVVVSTEEMMGLGAVLKADVLKAGYKLSGSSYVKTIDCRTLLQ